MSTAEDDMVAVPLEVPSAHASNSVKKQKTEPKSKTSGQKSRDAAFFAASRSMKTAHKNKDDEVLRLYLERNDALSALDLRLKAECGRVLLPSELRYMKGIHDVYGNPEVDVTPGQIDLLVDVVNGEVDSFLFYGYTETDILLQDWRDVGTVKVMGRDGNLLSTQAKAGVVAHLGEIRQRTVALADMRSTVVSFSRVAIKTLIDTKMENEKAAAKEDNVKLGNAASRKAYWRAVMSKKHYPGSVGGIRSQCTNCSGHNWSYEYYLMLLGRLRYNQEGDKVIEDNNRMPQLPFITTSYSTKPHSDAPDIVFHWLCPICRHERVCKELSEQADHAVSTCFHHAAQELDNAKIDVRWSDKMYSVKRLPYPGNIGFECPRGEEGIGSPPHTVITWREYVAYPAHDFPVDLRTIVGGRARNGFPYRYMLPPVLDADYGLVRFPEEGGYLLVRHRSDYTEYPFGYSQEPAWQMAAHVSEEEFAQEVSYSDRNAASAGHVADPGAPSPRCIKWQTEQPHIMSKRFGSTSTNNACYYFHEGGLKEYKSVYVAQRTNRLKKQDKETQLLGSGWQRKWQVFNMQHNLDARAVIEAAGLGLRSELLHQYHQVGRRMMQERPGGGTEYLGRTHRKWAGRLDVDDMTEHEALLLEWSATTGQMNNHYPAACHRDGNKTHQLEMMVYMFGKGGPNGSTNPELYFPLHGIGVVSRAGLGIAFSNLERVFHLADQSRGTTNFCMLSGP